MSSPLIAIEDLPTFRAASERARDISIRLTTSASIRRTPTGWAVLVPDTVAKLLSPAKPNNQPKSPVQESPRIPQVFDREISERQMFVLKAFYMGHAIALKPNIRAIAFQMIDAAIQHLDSSSSAQRLVFYLMMRAEISRHLGESPIELRARIRDLDSNMYEMFMAVEEATQSKKKVYGIQTLTIADEGVERTYRASAGDGWDTTYIQYDIACRALGIREADISASQQEFLSHTTLKAILDSHGVPFAP